MSDQAKMLRKQLRNIVQEILPSFLANEIGYEIQKKVQHDLLTHNDKRMAALEKHIKDQLEQIASRQKEVTEMLKKQIEDHNAKVLAEKIKEEKSGK